MGNGRAVAYPIVTAYRLADRAVVVRGGAIADVGAGSYVEVPEEAEVLDLKGSFVMPGLIGAHTSPATERVTLSRNPYSSPTRCSS